MFSDYWLITNALVKCLEDSDINVCKSCLDFMLKYINPLNISIFDTEKRSIILEALLVLLSLNDFSILK